MLLPAIVGAALSTALTGCVKLWEDERTEIIPLPEVETPITPDPWEPPKTDDKPVGL